MKGGALGGLVAGLIFVIVEMMLVPTIGGGSALGPPRMMAAIVMGEGVLPPPATFDLTIMMVGMLVHFVLSAVLGAAFGLVLGGRGLSTLMLIVLGTLFGLAVYAVNFYGFTALFPWFAMARGGITIFAHAVFGAVLGWWIARGSSEAA